MNIKHLIDIMFGTHDCELQEAHAIDVGREVDANLSASNRLQDTITELLGRHEPRPMKATQHNGQSKA